MIWFFTFCKNHSVIADINRLVNTGNRTAFPKHGFVYGLICGESINLTVLKGRNDICVCIKL